MSKTPDQNVITGQGASTVPRAWQSAMAQQVITGSAASTAPMATQAALGRLDVALPADHPAYASIGRVTAEWARLEHLLDAIIWEMAGVRHETGPCITGQMVGHAPRFNAIGALGLLCGLNASLLKEIEKTNHSLYELAKERNRVVHDAWYIDPATGQISQFRSVLPKKINFGPVDVNDQYTEELVARINKKCEIVSGIRSKMRQSLQTAR